MLVAYNKYTRLIKHEFEKNTSQHISNMGDEGDFRRFTKYNKYVEGA